MLSTLLLVCHSYLKLGSALDSLIQSYKYECNKQVVNSTKVLLGEYKKNSCQAWKCKECLCVQCKAI